MIVVYQVSYQSAPCPRIQASGPSVGPKLCAGPGEGSRGSWGVPWSEGSLSTPAPRGHRVQPERHEHTQSAMLRAMTTPAGKSKKSSPKTVAINVQLPESVHKKLRVKALNQGMTLAEAVTAAATAWSR